MKAADRVMAAGDRWQRSHRPAAVVYGVVKKFGDDSMNQLVVGLGWYGFVAIYPLLLAAVTVLGFIGNASLGEHLVTTLHQFPVVGPHSIRRTEAAPCTGAPWDSSSASPACSTAPRV